MKEKFSGVFTMENQPSISSDLIRGHIDTIILHSLIESDKFAQQISDDVESKSDGEYKINQATLYSSLKRLESLKLVSAYWHDYEGGRRKFFNITDYGKKTVEDNLSSWVYSRSIIDKLMNVSPAPVMIEQTPVKEFIKIEPTTVVEEPTKTQVAQDVGLKAPDADIAISSNKSEENSEQLREKNFRNILNGLISLSADSSQSEEMKKSENIRIEPIVSVSGENAKSEVQKFNTTIDETNYNANRANFNGKIDYGDLTLKAEKEGDRIRISSKDSAKPIGNILINKLNFFAMLIVFFAAALEIVAFNLLFDKVFDSTIVKILSFAAIIPVITYGIIYFCKRYKLSSKKISSDGILIAAIVAFNLILLNFAFDFLFEINLEDPATLVALLIIPVVYYVNSVFFFWLRYKLAPKKYFSYK